MCLFENRVSLLFYAFQDNFIINLKMYQYRRAQHGTFDFFKSQTRLLLRDCPSVRIVDDVTRNKL